MIPLSLPLQTVDIDTSAAAEYQTYVAWFVLALAIVGTLYLKLRLRYSELEPELRRHLRSIRPALSKASWRKIPIRAGEERGPRYQQVSKAATGDLESSSARKAVGTARGAISKRFPSVPPLAIRSAVLGVLLLWLGTLLAISREQWEALLVGSLSTTPTDPSAVVDGLVWLVQTTVPGGSTLVALAATVVLVLYESVLLEVWFLIGGLLIVLSLAVVELDRRTPTDLSPTLYPNRRRLALRGGLWVGLVWVAAFLGSLVSTGVGVAAGGLAALAVAGIVGKGLLERLYGVANLEPPWGGFHVRASIVRTGAIVGGAVLPDRVYTTDHAWPPWTSDRDSTDPSEIVAAAERAGGPLSQDPLAAADALETQLETAGAWNTGGDYTTLASVIVRQTVGVVALVALPIVAYFAALSVGTGSIFGPLLALGAAPWYVAALAVLALAVTSVWALTSIDRLAPVQQWARRRVATSAIRSIIAVRGIPVTAAVVGGLIGWAYFGAELASGSWYAWLATVAVVSTITAAIAVAVVLVGQRAWDRLGVWMLFSEDDPLPPTDQVVEVLDEPLEDGDGRPLYVARVDGRPFAARDPETLVRLTRRVVDERFETGETPTLLAHELYESAVERGVVDSERVFREIRGDLDLRIESTLEDHDGTLDYQTLVTELKDEYPPRLVDRQLAKKREQNEIGIRNGQCVLVDSQRGRWSS